MSSIPTPADSGGRDVVFVRRGGVIESEHRVHAAVVDASGRTVATVGDPGRITFFRSSAKPFQAVPLVEEGVASAYGLTQPELAVCCASHNGEPRHVELVAGLLARAGLGEAALECGAHAPFHGPSAAALRGAGDPPRRIHNNCSGKHAGMLLLATHMGWPHSGYVAGDHPLQRRMLAEVARWCELEESEIRTGVDGCGVLCFAVGVDAMARGYANLAGANAREEPVSQIVRAMIGYPYEVAGSGRLCTELMAAGSGDILAKLGAEGVYGAAWLSRGWGVGLKIEDGDRRALEAALVELLRQLGALPEEALGALAAFHRPVVTNTRNEIVGHVEPAFDVMGSVR